jgi:hypothetical protein
MSPTLRQKSPTAPAARLPRATTSSLPGRAGAFSPSPEGFLFRGCGKPGIRLPHKQEIRSSTLRPATTDLRQTPNYGAAE